MTAAGQMHLAALRDGQTWGQRRDSQPGRVLPSGFGWSGLWGARAKYSRRAREQAGRPLSESVSWPEPVTRQIIPGGGSGPHCRRSCSRRQRLHCSGSGRLRPSSELTVAATFRSFKRQGYLDTDDRSQGTADVASRLRGATQFRERQLNRCQRYSASRPLECLLVKGAMSL